MENILNVEVSQFQNYWAKKPMRKSNLYLTLTSDYASWIVQRIRAENDKAIRDELKARLPAFTMSGLFSYRSKSGLISHSGLICLEVDNCESPIKLRDEVLPQLDFVAYAGLSVSARGVFFLVPVAYPTRHEEHFNALQEELANYDIHIDPSGRDVCRLRGASYDEHAYFNIKAKRYERTKQERPQEVAPSELIYLDPFGNFGDFGAHGIEEAIARTQKNYAYTEGSRHLFRFTLALNCSRLGIGREEADKYINEHYPDDCRKCNAVDSGYKY